ncbi:MAG: lysozyme [Hyphomonadaceae bacterium]|nr:lysozyme [Hyphomonadaceae bacterium]
MAPLAIDILKHFEGWVPNAYNDPVGYCTIGYGHLIALNRCEQIQLGSFAAGLSEADGALLLEGDTLGARAAVQELVIVALTDEQFGALSDFVYNVGRRNFERSTLLELLNMGEYALAAAELRRWVRARGRILPGLVTRRACEESLFDGRLTYDIYGRFDRAACVSLGIADDVGPLIDVELGEDAN